MSGSKIIAHKWQIIQNRVHLSVCFWFGLILYFVILLRGLIQKFSLSDKREYLKGIAKVLHNMTSFTLVLEEESVWINNSLYSLFFSLFLAQVFCIYILYYGV